MSLLTSAATNQIRRVIRSRQRDAATHQRIFPIFKPRTMRNTRNRTCRNVGWHFVYFAFFAVQFLIAQKKSVRGQMQNARRNHRFQFRLTRLGTEFQNRVVAQQFRHRPRFFRRAWQRRKLESTKRTAQKFRSSRREEALIFRVF